MANLVTVKDVLAFHLKPRAGHEKACHHGQAGGKHKACNQGKPSMRDFACRLKWSLFHGLPRMAKTDSGIGLPTGIFDDPFNCAGFDFSVALDVTNEKGRLAKGIYNARHPVRFIPNQSSSLTGKKVWSFVTGHLKTVLNIGASIPFVKRAYLPSHIGVHPKAAHCGVIQLAVAFGQSKKNDLDQWVRE